MGKLFILFSTFLSIIITPKKPIKKGLNSNNKSRLAYVTRFPFKDFISEWQFEQTKKKLHKIFIKTTSCVVLSCGYFFRYAWKHVKFHYE